ncbi:MAG: prolipoprotein diacylglyceryl transferase [Bacteroidales bacterium]|nr:prolipoprotein diacylglyceryl transferase [Bacteroidales bacterium]
MYPRISDFVNDVFGTGFNWPVQSYGFFLALAFVAGGYTLWLELKRKENEGFLTARKVPAGARSPGWIDRLVTFVVGFIAGFKFFLLFDDYQSFADDPQGSLLSLQGNVWIGLLVGGLMLAWSYYSEKRVGGKANEDEYIYPYQHTPMLVLIAAIAGIVGAKLFHIFENMAEFSSDPMGALLSLDGLTFYGGLLVAAGAVAWYGQKNGIHWRLMGDMVAPGLILAYGVGRMGCHVAGDGDWGIVNTLAKPDWLFLLPDWLWAYDYPNNILGEGIPIPGCDGSYCFRLAEPVFPTPVYETTLSLIIFGVLWFLRKKFSVPGVLFAIYLILNGIERFAIEQIRVNNTFDLLGITVTQAQVISTSLIIVGIILLWWFKKYPNILTKNK